jgi:hypothetical protein
MGVIPCTDGITIEFGCQFRVELRDSSLETILKAFCKLLPEMFVAYSVSGKACIMEGRGQAQGERMAAGDVGAYGGLCDTAIG